ncbi:MAG: hypothetical protein AB1632_13555 [Nitrospirota bacterium]
MKRSSLITILIQIFLLSALTLSSAEKNRGDAQSILSQKIKDACAVIDENIKKGGNIKKFVKTSIQMGYGACPIIKCSIKGGGDLEQIITGAIEAGATTDVVSRCAIDAGAEAKEVAYILGTVSSPGLCYILPEDQPLPQPPPPPPPISPSKF